MAAAGSAARAAAAAAAAEAPAPPALAPSAPKTTYGDYSETLKPPAESANASVWRAWWAKAKPGIKPFLHDKLFDKLPDAAPNKKALTDAIKDPTSTIRIGLKMEAMDAAARTKSLAPLAPSSSSAANKDVVPDVGAGSSSSTTPCAGPSCENIADHHSCRLCPDCCTDDACSAPRHITAKLRRERDARRALQQRIDSSSAPKAPSGTLDPSTMATLLTIMAKAGTAQPNPIPNPAPAPADADPGPAPPGSVAHGPLRTAQDPSITWFQVISQWRTHPFCSDDTDRVTAAFDHVSAAWSQRATTVFHRFYSARGPADITRRFETLPPPSGTSPGDWEAERSDKILACNTTLQHLLNILRAYARSRFAIPGKNRKAVWFAVIQRMESNEFYAIKYAQAKTPILDPANPTISEDHWASPDAGFWWMLFAASLRTEGSVPTVHREPV